MAAARMQRWEFLLSAYDFKICHIKGLLNHADALSRIPQLKCEEEISGNEQKYVNWIESNNELQLNFQNIANETRRDKILSKLVDANQNGTIDSAIKHQDLVAFKSKKDELSVESNCLLWGYRT